MTPLYQNHTEALPTLQNRITAERSAEFYLDVGRGPDGSVKFDERLRSRRRRMKDDPIAAGTSVWWVALCLQRRRTAPSRKPLMLTAEARPVATSMSVSSVRTDPEAAMIAALPSTRNDSSSDPNRP